jgi:hypothetical protein
MMTRLLSLALVLFWCTTSLFAQSLEFTTLTKLPGTINSEAEEGMPLLAPDGKKLYFTRAVYDGNIGGRYAGQDIWLSENGSEGWKRADNRSLTVNSKDNNAVIGMNKDGKTLYYLSSSPASKLNGIYFSKLINNYWTRPEFIPIPGIDNQDFVGFYVSPDFDVIFLSMRGPDSRGEEDIYVSTKDAAGQWTKPKNIGASINTSGFEISPYLSSDKRRLYFSSNGHSGFGDADIYYSDRLYDSWETWSAPVNLGEQVNSKKFDAYFSIYGDTVAYFSSNRDTKLADLYKIKVVQGTGLLAKGQRYLTSEEWNEYIGKNVMRRINFDPKITSLNPAQKELLYYIANKVTLQKEIGFHLVVKEEEGEEMTQARLKNIYSELRQVGIEASRIHDDQKPGAVKSAKGGAIEILLFK